MPTSSMATARVLASILLGYASTILGFWMAGYFAFASYYFLTRNLVATGGQSWRVFIFAVTRPSSVAFGLWWIGLVAVLGGVAYRLVPRERRGERATLAGSAGRLAVLALAGVGVDALIVAGLLGYRLYRLFD